MRPQPSHPARETGLSLIELVVFMVVLSAALAGVLRVFIQAGAHSADPLQQRQALAIAESLLDEIELMPYTYCDPDDANAAAPVISLAGCSSVSGRESMGPEAGETRFAAPQFDNVNDYNGYAMNGIVDITNTPIAALSGYSASVTVAAAALGNSFYAVTVADNKVLKITVTVTSPDGSSLALDGYRSFYAPSPAI
jgi:MSHA pilin protein MshD